MRFFKARSDRDEESSMPSGRLLWSVALAAVLALPAVHAEEGCPAGRQPTGGNLLANGDFSSGFDGWQTGDWALKAPNAIPSDNGVAVITGHIDGAGGVVDQDPFPGDAANGVPATDTWLYTNGNNGAAPATLATQTLDGLVDGETYVVSGYYSNAIKSTVDLEDNPELEVAIDGTAIFGPQDIPENTSPDWQRFEGTFVASGSTATLAFIDHNQGVIGDDLGITAVSVTQCSPAAAAAIEVSPTTLAFPDTTVGESSTALAATIRNSGTAPLTLTSLTPGGDDVADFVIDLSACGDSLAAGDECQVFASFKPQTLGDKVARILVSSSEGNTTIALTGTSVSSPVGTLAVSPDNYTFPRTAPGNASEARVVTVTNNGPGPLTIESLTPSSAAFTVSGGSCSVGEVLEANTDCTVEVQFTPETEGSQRGTLSVATDVSTAEVALFGFGGPDPVGVLIVEPNNALFADTIVGGTGDTQSFKFTNNGAADITLGATSIGDGFEVTGSSCETGVVLAPSASCTIDVTFKPVAEGLNGAELTLESSTGSASAGMAGQGLPSPVAVLSVKPDTVVLPTTPVDSVSAAASAEVRNIGQSPLQLGAITLTGANLADFVLDDIDCAGKTLAADESCTLNFTFKPGAEGLRQATVTVASDANSGSFRLVGFATPALAGRLETTPVSHAFANTTVGHDSAPVTVTVTNAGNLDTHVNAVRLDGANPGDFQADVSGCQDKDLAVAEHCQIEVVFAPTDIGAKSAVLTVASPEGAAQVSLSGFATAAPSGDIEVAADVLANGLDFGNILLGQTSDVATVTVNNKGNAPLTIQSVTTQDPGQFSVDASACTNGLVPARSSCDLAVTFSPLAAGPQSTTLSIASDDPTLPVVTVGLRGVGSTGDRDKDGLPDNIEEAGPTNPDVADTDGDGLLDGVEDANANGVFDEGETNPVDEDTDGDGINDGVEDRNHDGVRQDNETDPRIKDTDGDGISDGTEDSNHDGLFNFGETDPLKVDTDGDGIPDGVEDANKNGKVDPGETDPRVSETAVAGTEGGKVVETGLKGGAGAFGLPGLTLLGGLLLFRRRRLLTLVALLALGWLATPLHAAEDNFYVGLGGGVSLLKPDRNGTIWSVTDDQDTGYKGFLGYDLRDFLSLEGYYSDLGAAELTAAPEKGTIDYKVYGVNALYYLPNNKPGLQVFLKAGIGKIDTKSNKVPFRQVENTQITTGAGLEWLHHTGFGLRLDYDYFDKDAQFVSLNLLKRFGLQPAAPKVVDSDGDGVRDENDECPHTPLGKTVNEVGCVPPADSDGDGVNDDKDKCPATAHGVTVDDNGCPTDSDHDGVIDAQDKCPGTATGVKVGSDGCPLDSDGDGVIDAQDKCPGTAAGVEVGPSGCPLDSDGDGVVDSIDKCPNTTAGAQVDKNGCVYVVETTPPPTTIVERFSGVLEGVNFYTNSARLTPLAKVKLDGIAKQLLEYPDARILVVGHTDSQGSAAHNRRLSIARARTVANYLVRRGLPASHIRYTGRGESEPIATNATPEGRAQNRRVELIVRE